MDVTNCRVNLPDECNIVCLCGSTKFKKSFEKINAILTLNSKVVLSVGVFAHNDNIEISNSHFIIKDDSIQNQLSINNSFIKEISQVQNGVNFEIESFNGNFSNIKINDFNSIVNFEGDKLYLNNTYLRTSSYIF